MDKIAFNQQIDMMSRRLDDLRQEEPARQAQTLAELSSILEKIQQTSNDWHRQSRNHYASLFENNHSIMLLINPETAAITDANHTACAFYGYTRAELTGMKISDINMLTDEEVYQEMQRAQSEERNHFEFRHRLANGEIRDVDVFSGPILIGDKKRLYSVIHDITRRKQAEAALADSETSFRLLYERAPLAYQSLDSDGRLIQVNQAWLEMLGYQYTEVVGRWFGDFLTPDDAAQFRSAFELFKRVGQSHGNEFTMIHKDGAHLRISLEGRIGFDEEGHFRQTHCIASNITEKRDWEQQLTLQSSALAAAANSIVITGSDGTIEWVNPAFTWLTGYEMDEAIGQNLRIVKSGKHAPAFHQELWDTITAGEVWHGRMLNQRKDGALYHEEMTVTPVLDETGQIAHFIAVKQDITEKIAAEEKLEKWAQVFEHADWGIVTGSADGRTLEMMNPAFARMHGYTVEELLGRPIIDVFAPEYRADVPEHIRVAHEQGQHTFESWHIRKDGSRFPVLINITAVKDEAGNVRFRAVNVQDISARVRAEVEIRQRNAELALINRLNHAANRGDSLAEIIDLMTRQAKDVFAAKDASIYLVSDDKQYLVLQKASLSPALTRRLEKLIGMKIPPVHIRLDENSLYQDILQSGQAAIVNDPVVIHQMMAEHTENRFLKTLVPQIGHLLKYGSVMHVPLLSGEEPIGLLDIARETPVDRSHLKQLAMLGEQLTAVIQRKRAEEAWKRANRQNALILQAAGEGIYGLDADGATIFVNEAAEKMTGWSAEELIGQLHHGFVHHSRADGAPYPASDCPVHATCRDGRARHVSDEVFWRKDGSSLPVEYTCQPIAENGELLGVVVTFKDISERLRQEAYLQGQQRLATVGQLAAGIAHDFNNIMAVISLYTDLTQRTLDPHDASQKRLRTIREQANRAADLIQQILDFSRQTTLERRRTDLRPFLKELIKLLQRTLPENIHLNMDYGEGKFTVNADLTQLQQVLMNLAVNARDAMPDGGELHLRLAHLHLDEGDAPPLPDIPPGDWALLAVADSGSGITPEDLSHIFEPFFTTKLVGKGTGLGLAQVYGIVKQHNGYIGVASEVGAGTTFSIYLPIATAAEEPALPEPAAPLPEGNGETILVVEDEATIRTAVCDILTSLNYRPLPAANGEEALQVYAQSSGTVALVLSDMMMSGMNGMELHAQLQAANPDLKTILLSGYPLAEKEVWQREGITDWIKKPVNMEQLAQALHQALEIDSR